MLMVLYIVFLNSLTLRRIISLGGFRLLYVTAWLGVPIHETSHLIAALIGGHKIRKFRPFNPNPKTGQLGIVETSFDDKRKWSRYIGNTILPIAPLIGGTALILLLVRFLMPDFSTTLSSTVSPPTPNAIDSIDLWQIFLSDLSGQLTELIQRLWRPEIFTQWQTYLVGYFVVCIALHIAPSSTDWHNFLKPAIFLLYHFLKIVSHCDLLSHSCYRFYNFWLIE